MTKKHKNKKKTSHNQSLPTGELLYKIKHPKSYIIAYVVFIIGMGLHSVIVAIFGNYSIKILLIIYGLCWGYIFLLLFFYVLPKEGPYFIYAKGIGFPPYYARKYKKSGSFVSYNEIISIYLIKKGLPINRGIGIETVGGEKYIIIERQISKVLPYIKNALGSEWNMVYKQKLYKK